MSEHEAPETRREDEDFGLARDAVSAVAAALEAGDAPALAQLLEGMHPADIADLLEQLDPEDRRELLRMWGSELEGEVLSELDEGLREEVIAALSPEALGEAVRELETDDVVDLVEDLEEEQREEILAALPADDRAAVEQSLAYPEGTAGRLMQREFVSVPEHWTVGDAIDYLRAAEELPEDFYHVILVDPRMRPTGYVPLGRILANRRDVPLKDLRDESFRTIHVLQDVEDVAYVFNHYHLISAPVVDDDGRLTGVVTIDDAMAVLDEEAEEDILRLAGVGDESLSDRISEIAKARFVWLFVNLLTAILASLVIDYFSEAIEAAVALAVLMPIMASMGGNAGTQSMTVAVRALATRDLTMSNAWRVIQREVAVGALNGAAFGLIMAVVAGVWFGMPMLPVVVASAMVLTLVSAALGGILIPLALDRLGVDPALASGPFVTTVTDLVSFGAFLGLASWILL
ncbi:magnesium transporter [Meinhardsimonia xiamenensis]|jgi:magnesium transporter|uniref:Magnesium transporter MgtE n=1 Tax=Meinhardsimonia xiamenensis TaxID=990712 RepID=A0A1G9CD88_9RHOB|nr:magnesium transporter [Meinhardsimonia xiamenensis]PRX38409.1 magnesium transporter [Meinhardsimonia xiamenensis]SDK49375.1 magnesium transporter [Meinhardsimonia xiamenensis]